MNGDSLDTGERLVGFVERDDPNFADLACLAHGVEMAGPL
jgi:hypothetical protein